jgi:hypothetical protein
LVSLSPRNAAFLGQPIAQFERLSPLLQRAGYRIHRATDAVSVLDSVWSTPLEMIIVNHPVTGLDLDDLLTTIRDRSSPSRNAGLILVLGDDDLRGARSYLGRGVNRVVARSLLSEGLVGAVGDLLDVSPRLPVRAMVQVESRDGSRSTRTLTRTQDLSLTGMLIQGGQEFPLGSEFSFELHLPGEDIAVVGSARVVRRCDTEREPLEGVGASFAGFEGNGHRWLASFLEREAS